MSVLLVPDGLDGERVDVAAARMSGVSRSRISSLIEDGGVFLDGQQVSRASVRVSAARSVTACSRSSASWARSWSARICCSAAFNCSDVRSAMARA